MKTILITLTLLMLASCISEETPIATPEQQGREWVKAFFEHQGAPASMVAKVELDSLINNKEAYFSVLKHTENGKEEMQQLLLYFKPDGTLDDELNTEIYYK